MKIIHQQIKLALIPILLLIAQPAKASLIDSGYSLEGNVVKGTVFEWLQWNVTAGMSIDSALSAYGSVGWSLASNQQMADLFNQSGVLPDYYTTTWIADENTYQTNFSVSPGDPSTEVSARDDFLSLFGITQTNSSSSDTYAIYGSDLDNDGLYNLAKFKQYNNSSGICSGFCIGLSADDTFSGLNSSFNSSALGIALVRNVTARKAVNPIPAPSSILLLCLGLVVLLRHRI